MKIGVIGGGASGFFAAITAAEKHPSASVTILEKTPKLLSKVKVSGGGRCNVTNAESDIPKLSLAYPRGRQQLKKSLHSFNTVDTVQWFESRGVPLMVQEDNCIFPVSQDSQSVIDCFLNEAKRLKIEIKIRHGVDRIEKIENQIIVHFISRDLGTMYFDKLIVATGGSPKMSGLNWMADLGHKIKTPVPSLFTFNMPQETVTSLMGIVVEDTMVSIAGTKLKSDGPLLITHWGMSGPAILKLSAFGARILEERDYRCTALINWVSEPNHEVVATYINQLVTEHRAKHISNYRPYQLPDRLWQYMIKKCDLNPEKRWDELGKKEKNRIVNILTNDSYQVEGKTTFKEEFVTCGGVSLDSINIKTMESRVCPGLYFAGEVMDVDGITGGYNFQSAWTTGYIAGHLK